MSPTDYPADQATRKENRRTPDAPYYAPPGPQRHIRAGPGDCRGGARCSGGRQAAYQGNLAIDTAAAQSTSRRSFEAHALIPRTITDNVSPRTRSSFKEAHQVRSASGYSRRARSADRNRTFERASMARSKSLAALRDEGSREITIGMLNTHLRHADGDSRRMPKNLQRRQQDIDLTIRVAERANTREHTVYVAADLTGMPGKTPRQKIAKARKMIQ